MQFIQNRDDGSCIIKFSKEEIKIIQEKKELFLPAETLRHFGNVLMKIVYTWNEIFPEDIKNKMTQLESDKIEGKSIDDK